MWIMTNFGVFSASLRRVKDVPAGDDRLIQIRSRRKGDLERLRQRYDREISKVVTDVGTDYRYRVYCTHDQLAGIVAMFAQEIDYTNFKNSVKSRKLHDAYMRIWWVIFDAFDDYPKVLPKSWRRSSRKSREDDAVLERYTDDDDQVTVDVDVTVYTNPKFKKNWWEDAQAS